MNPETGMLARNEAEDSVIALFRKGTEPKD
jgi:hypothetical protein